jgi:hypothetical protein
MNTSYVHAGLIHGTGSQPDTAHYGAGVRSLLARSAATQPCPRGSFSGLVADKRAGEAFGLWTITHFVSCLLLRFLNVTRAGYRVIAKVRDPSSRSCISMSPVQVLMAAGTEGNQVQIVVALLAAVLLVVFLLWTSKSSAPQWGRGASARCRIRSCKCAQPFFAFLYSSSTRPNDWCRNVMIVTPPDSFRRY